jgi:hypothetical protein
MKRFIGISVLLGVALLAACGGKGLQQPIGVTTAPASTVAATADVNAVQTKAAASVFATETAAAQTAAPPTGSVGGSADFITNVVMATSTHGANFDPVGITTTFSPEATFHAVVTITDAPDSSKIKAMWYAVDVGSAASPNTLIDQYELTTNGSRNIDYTLNPKSAWPQGTYRVDIYGNGTLAKGVTFQVQAGAPSQAPGPTSTPTSSASAGTSD